tara:strand:- start:5184 stop:5669 length:486 start_codon:yes stop_codon:yes gene_type:complete
MIRGNTRAVHGAARLARQRAIVPFVVGMAFLFAGCTSAPPLQTVVETLPDKQVEIFWARAYPRRDGVLVTGQVRRAGMSQAVLWGHLHVSVSIEGATEPVSVDTRWIGRLSSRVRRSARFSVLIPAVSIDSLRSISVQYRTGQDTSPDDGSTEVKKSGSDA